MDGQKPMRKKKKKWSLKRAILLFVSAAMVGLVIFFFNAEHLAGNQLPMPFGYGVAVVLSGSMEPVLSAGDVVVVRETQEVAAGDVIVYQSGHSLVVHRVIAVENGVVTTKGDANNAADTPFESSAVKGTVMFSVPLLGYVVQAVKTPAGVLIIMAVAILLLELSYRGDRKKQDEEIEKLKEEIRSLQNEKSDKKENITEDKAES